MSQFAFFFVVGVIGMLWLLVGVILLIDWFDRRNQRKLEDRLKYRPFEPNLTYLDERRDPNRTSVKSQRNGHC